MSIGRRLREGGPAALIPAAWTVAALAEGGITTEQPVRVMHAVMIVVMIVFVTASNKDMQDGVLRWWFWTIIAGIPVVGVGLLGLATTLPISSVSFHGWMVLPVPALLATGRWASDWASLVYLSAASFCVLGALVAGQLSAVAGIALVAVGQTAAILTAILAH